MFVGTPRNCEKIEFVFYHAVNELGFSKILLTPPFPRKPVETDSAKIRNLKETKVCLLRQILFPRCRWLFLFSYYFESYSTSYFKW